MLRLHVGQAGGQIGAQLCSLTGAPSASGHGAVFVDSEPKVVAPLVADAGAARVAWLPKSAAVYDHNGRGNNWAWGYTSVASRLGVSAADGAGGDAGGATAVRGAAGGARTPLVARALDAVRLHAERMGRFEGVLLVHSLGGGTGAGLGSRLLESLRDEFGDDVMLVTASVAPFNAGDTPTQAYNTVLSVAAAARAADAVLFFSNDDLLARAARAKRGALSLGGGASAASVADARVRTARAGCGGVDALLASVPALGTRELNAVIAESLAALAAPVPLGRRGRAHPRAPLRRVRDADASGGAPDGGRPAWRDVRESGADADGGGGAAAAVPEPFAVEAARDASDAGASRDSWLRHVESAPSADAAECARARVAAALAPDDEGGAGGALGAAAFEAFDFADLLNDVLAHGPPLAKFLDVRSVRPPPGAPAASPAASWAALADALVEGTPRYDSAARVVTTRAARLYCRGATAADCDAAVATATATASPPPRVGQAPPPPLWPGLPCGAGTGADWARVSLQLTRATVWAAGADLRTARSARVFSGPVWAAGGAGGAAPLRTLTAVANNDAFAASIVRAVARAEDLLAANAYVHTYQRFGVGAEDITAALHECLDVVEAYRPPG
jgi:hypothetical protein